MGTPPSLLLMMMLISVILQGPWYYSCNWQETWEFQDLPHSQWLSISRDFALVGDIWQCLRTFLVIGIRRCYWHPVGLMEAGVLVNILGFPEKPPQ